MQTQTETKRRSQAAGPQHSDSRPAQPLPLFVAVNAACNLKCWYCTENGENRFVGGGRLSAKRLAQVLEAAYASGVRAFRFTGGEPTQRRNLDEILLATQALGDDVQVALTTNGAHLGRLAETLAEMRAPKIFLSVDGFGEESADNGEFRIEKWLTPALMGVVDSLRSTASIRLNFVLTASSAPQFPALLEYATQTGTDIKVFELLLRNFYYAGDRPRLRVFREQYVPVRRLLPELHARYGAARRFAGTGGRGIPMWAFETGTNRIIYFDSSEGSHYGEVCRDCPLFPCQEGLYALVLDANGTLHPAGCANSRLRAHVAIADEEGVKAAFHLLQKAIAEATLQRVVPPFIAPQTTTA